jgi:regulator of extracellular matrix RemA (YlzA/DUF370 family)
MHIGFDSHVPWWRVAAVLAARGSAAKRLREEAYRAGRLLDATYGKRTRSLVITDTNQVILSIVTPETLMPRLLAAREKDQED